MILYLRKDIELPLGWYQIDHEGKEYWVMDFDYINKTHPEQIATNQIGCVATEVVLTKKGNKINSDRNIYASSLSELMEKLI